MFLQQQHIALSRVPYDMKRLKVRNVGGGTTEFGGFREDAGCFCEIIHSLKDKEPRPCTAEIGDGVEESKVCSADNGIGNLCVESGSANEHHRTTVNKLFSGGIPHETSPNMSKYDKHKVEYSNTVRRKHCHNRHIQ
jgi:hypothetical protein